MMIGLYLLLNFIVLFVVARASAARGWRLALMLLVLGFVVGLANNLIEAVVFGVMSLRDAVGASASALPMFALLAVAAAFLAGRWRGVEATDAPMLVFTPLRLLGVVVAYEALYWGAGTLVYPYIADFYATRRIPAFPLVAALQVVRSLIFAAAAYPFLKSGLRGAPWVLAITYGVLAGLAPLLPDNPYMPPEIRFYHAIETSVSNFLFGLVVGLLLTRQRTAAQA